MRGLGAHRGGFILWDSLDSMEAPIYRIKAQVCTVVDRNLSFDYLLTSKASVFIPHSKNSNAGENLPKFHDALSNPWTIIHKRPHKH